ncbi:MAG: TolC family protein [Nitrospiraceae bacterium]|nr:TolC family protein [Nitrospiraceae bacterium]
MTERKFYFIRVIFSVIFLLSLPFHAAGEEIIKKNENLNLERCIELAFKFHPSIVAAKNNVLVNQSKIGQAQSNYFPQLSASGGYSKIKSASGGSTLKSDNPYDQYTSSINLNQMLFDFGKTPTQVRIQEFNRDASKADLDNIIDQTIFNVKQAYYNLLQTKRSRDVALETVAQYQQHLEQAKGFFSVGTKSKFDVTKAEVDLSTAKLNLIKAENNLKIAFVTLNNAMGIPNAPEYTLVDNLTVKKQHVTLQEAIETAFKNRPDLISLTAKKEAAKESVSLAKKGYYPVLNGSAAYNWSAQKFPLQEGWTAGVTMTFPIFSGFLTRHQVKEAEANLDLVRANEEALKNTIQLNIRQAYLQLLQAEESTTTAELAVKQATENLEIANGRYEAGISSPIEVTDAQVAYSNSKLSHIQALYDYQLALASLEQAMGLK